MGFRAAYLVSMCTKLSNNNNILEVIKQSNYKDAIRILCRFSGIGEKVANCVALFSLHHTEAFPVDTHMRQIIDTEYNGIIDIKRFANLAGIIQQYIFYYKAFGNK